MRIKNPINSELEVQIKGEQYVVPALGEITGVPAEHALYWKTRLHEFIIVSEEKAPEQKVEKVVDEVVKEAETKKSNKK